ncbi:MAG TPA: carbonic anhydrase, partial [Vicinamibacterales bacterium]|nr:carbonic anhydrase [Vicinamibacterales bacterium]
IFLLIGGVARAQHATAPAAGPTADAVLAELKTGNEHHATKRYAHPHETADRQKELASGQQPHASVLACADSRVPPEIVFDQGLGDLFVIRVAGNVAGDDELASLEYAAEHLNVPLVVVLGHQKCGGVTAAVQGGEAPGHLPALMKLLQPAVEKTKGMPGDAVANAVRANVQMVVEQLRASKPLLGELAAAGKMKVVGGVYSLDTGRVDWLR